MKTAAFTWLDYERGDSMALKQIEITGKVTFNFVQRRWIPEDEISELMESEANLIANVDMDEVKEESPEWEDVEGKVL